MLSTEFCRKFFAFFTFRLFFEVAILYAAD